MRDRPRDSYLWGLPPAQGYFRGADHVDVKAIESAASLREFLAGFLSYYPAWIKALYGVRAVFVSLLGMKQPHASSFSLHLTPDQIPFEAGRQSTIFTVKDSCEDAFWFAGVSERHLTADLLIGREPLSSGRVRYHIGTVVHYHHWTGPVYFNVIRPFHHLVVHSMIKAGANQPSRSNA